MSDALDYLKKVRPEATEAYFEFLRSSSGQLDDKTRFLISVITKIDNQTEKGFKQYLKRALESGNSANDILDAILIAFPTLGLSKIIWAVNIILDMGLPEFLPENLSVSKTWHSVCDLKDLSEGANYLKVESSPIIVWKELEKIAVYSVICPHQSTEMSALNQADNRLTCSKHQWAFDLSNGQCIEKGNKPLTILKHTVKNNRLEVQC